MSEELRGAAPEREAARRAPKAVARLNQLRAELKKLDIAFPESEVRYVAALQADDKQGADRERALQESIKERRLEIAYAIQGAPSDPTSGLRYKAHQEERAGLNDALVRAQRQTQVDVKRQEAARQAIVDAQKAYENAIKALKQIERESLGTYHAKCAPSSRTRTPEYRYGRIDRPSRNGDTLNV